MSLGKSVSRRAQLTVSNQSSEQKTQKFNHLPFLLLNQIRFAFPCMAVSSSLFLLTPVSGVSLRNPTAEIHSVGNTLFSFPKKVSRLFFFPFFTEVTPENSKCILSAQKPEWEPTSVVNSQEQNPLTSPTNTNTQKKTEIKLFQEV